MNIYKSNKTKGYLIKDHYYLYDERFIIDLTLKFGKGNEPTTLDDERMKPFIKYKTYNSGDLQ